MYEDLPGSNFYTVKKCGIGLLKHFTESLLDIVEFKCIIFIMSRLDFRSSLLYGSSLQHLRPRSPFPLR